MKAKIKEMLAAEDLVIDRHRNEVTRDPPLVRAEIRAELLREIIATIDKKSTNEVKTCPR